VPASREEYAGVLHLAKVKGVTPVLQGISCPFYQKGRCQVHEARPTMCRVFGHVKEMPCIKGYNVNVKPEIVAEMIGQSGAYGNAVLLHQALVDMGVCESLEAALGPQIGPLLQQAINGQKS
jgi:Fe-S-cluster containining protein